MTKMFLLRSFVSQCSCRSISTTSKRLMDNPSNMFSESGAYKGAGRTTVNVLNKEVHDWLLIDSFSTHGFRLNSGLFIIGPAAVFPRTIFHWDVADHRSVSPESMSLFVLLEPKVDILLIGAGDKGNSIPEETRAYLKAMKINHEVLSTGDACGQFNFLNADCRNVACAIIPPGKVTLETEIDYIANLNFKKRLHAVEQSSVEELHRLDEARREMELQKDMDDRLATSWNKPVMSIEEAVKYHRKKSLEKRRGPGYVEKDDDPEDKK